VLDPGVDFLLTTFLEHIVEIHIPVDKVRARFDEHLCVIAENNQKNVFKKAVSNGAEKWVDYFLCSLPEK
jgi:hypothetical protein